MIEQLETNFSSLVQGRGTEMDYTMAAFYNWNKTSIGLRCFVFGILVVPGLFETLRNALILEAANARRPCRAVDHVADWLDPTPLGSFSGCPDWGPPYRCHWAGGTG